MKALLKKSRGLKDLALVDLPVPEPAPNEVLARVAYAGICGSDLDILYNRNSIYTPPVVLGHEFSAVVERVGAEVAGFQPGDKIVSETVFSVCQGCAPCQAGAYHLCLNKEAVGWTRHGAFAEYILLNAAYIHLLPAGADLAAAALLEPSAVAAEGVCIKGRLQAGHRVGIIGPGTTGLLSALIALAGGASQVFLLGRNSAEPVRFPLARSLGIQACINTAQTDPVQTVRTQTGGCDLDLVVDTSGNIQGFELALELVKRNGIIVETGSITSAEGFPWARAAWKALELSFVYSASHQAWQEAIRLFGQAEPGYHSLVTQVYPLEQFEEAFDIADRSDRSFKVLFQPLPTGESCA